MRPAFTYAANPLGPHPLSVDIRAVPLLVCFVVPGGLASLDVLLLHGQAG